MMCQFETPRRRASLDISTDNDDIRSMARQSPTSERLYFDVGPVCKTVDGSDPSSSSYSSSSSSSSSWRPASESSSPGPSPSPSPSPNPVATESTTESATVPAVGDTHRLRRSGQLGRRRTSSGIHQQRRYSIPLDRFWKTDQQDLLNSLSSSSAAAAAADARAGAGADAGALSLSSSSSSSSSSPFTSCRGLYVEINLLQPSFDGCHKFEEELLGRNITGKVVKATLCYPDPLTPKCDFIDVL